MDTGLLVSDYFSLAYYTAVHLRYEDHSIMSHSGIDRLPNSHGLTVTGKLTVTPEMFSGMIKSLYRVLLILVLVIGYRYQPGRRPGQVVVTSASAIAQTCISYVPYPTPASPTLVLVVH